jgi:ornithine carbamoyltransferase
MSDLLSLREIGAEAVREILALSEQADLGRPLAGHGVALVFEKPSARTRNSMEMAVVRLGGHPVYIQKDEVGIDSRETAEDVARTLACYHQVIAARVKQHDHLTRMAAATDKPVLNLLSDTDHPLQGLADLLTIKQLAGQIEGVKVAFLGDGENNVARSLAEGCALMGAELTIATPPGFELQNPPEGVRQVSDPAEAVAGAQFVYTDVWVSMGQDAESGQRMLAMEPFRVTPELMARADNAWFLHCLPARRGQEVVAEVIDGPRSAVWRQAENRMHTARAALAWLMGARA